MSLIKRIRMMVASFMVSYRWIRVPFKRIIMDEKVLAYVMDDPKFQQRVRENKSLRNRMEKIALDRLPSQFPSPIRSRLVSWCLDYCLNEPGLTHLRKLLDETVTIDALAASPDLLKLLFQRQCVHLVAAEYIGGDQLFSEQLFSTETFRKSLCNHLLGNPALLEELVDCEALQDCLHKRKMTVEEFSLPSRQENILQLFESNSTVLSSFLNSLLNTPVGRTVLLNRHLDDTELRHALEQPGIGEVLVTREEQLPALLETLTSSKAGKAWLLNRHLDDTELRHALEQPGIGEVLCSYLELDIRLLDYLLNSKPGRNYMVNRALSAEEISNFLDQPAVIEQLVIHTDQMHKLSHNEAFAQALCQDADFLRLIFSTPAQTSRILAGTRIMQSDACRGNAEAIAMMERLRTDLQRYLPLINPDLEVRMIDTESKLNTSNSSMSALIGLFCKDTFLELRDANIQFLDRRSLCTCIDEILLHEEYYFSCESDRPRILDCGANFGLAIYYFKHLYPNSNIIAFEPIHTIRRVAEKNISDNNYRNVTLLPYAISDVDGDATFIVSKELSMGGSLTDRRLIAGDDTQQIVVETRRLSHYLQEPIDFLKLDVEGSEDLILAEASPLLGNVQHIFCEYHHALGMASDRLTKILSILDAAGFEYHLGKSLNHGRSMGRQSMKYVGGPYSAVIHARNRDWPEGKHRASANIHESLQNERYNKKRSRGKNRNLASIQGKGIVSHSTNRNSKDEE